MIWIIAHLWSRYAVAAGLGKLGGNQARRRRRKARTVTLSVMGVYVVVIGLAFLSVVSTTAGIALALRFHRSRNGIAFGIGFSAGQDASASAGMVFFSIGYIYRYTSIAAIDAPAHMINTPL